MSNLGMISAYSAYSTSASSIYAPRPVSRVEEVQQLPAEKTSMDESANDEINDEAIISDEANALLAADQAAAKVKSAEESIPINKAMEADKTESTTPKEDAPQDAGAKSGDTLTPEQLQEISQLKARDAEVKAHEQAHIAAAAGINASAPSFDYQTGPDGEQYAVGGEVSISFSQSQDPEENIANAETMKAAALAPADPSSQDLSVASNADKMIQAAREQLAKQQEAEKQEDPAEAGDKFSETAQTSGTETAGSIADTSNDNEIKPTKISASAIA